MEEKEMEKPEQFKRLSDEMVALFMQNHIDMNKAKEQRKDQLQYVSDTQQKVKEIQDKYDALKKKWDELQKLLKGK